MSFHGPFCLFGGWGDIVGFAACSRFWLDGWMMFRSRFFQLSTKEGCECQEIGHAIKTQIHGQTPDLFVSKLFEVSGIGYAIRSIRRFPIPIDLTPAVGFYLLLVPGWVKVHRERRTQERSDQGHDDKNGKGTGTKDLSLKANVLCTVTMGELPRLRVQMLTRTINSTRPLQLIKEPIAKHSRHSMPLKRAAAAAPTNLAKKATATTPIT